MCLRIVAEPLEHKNVSDLKIGTWFTDQEGQIYVVVNDDDSEEARILCIGEYFNPFIVNLPTTKITISKILGEGTVLKIVKPLNSGGLS